METKSKHTPGPWRLTAIPAGNSLTVMVSGSAGYDLVDALGNDAPTNPADARLIAAAPELAEALAELVRMADDTRYDTEPCNWSTDAKLSRHEKLRMARAALAKAGVR